MVGKPIWKSRTVWVNGLVIAIAVVSLAVSDLGLEAEVVKWLLFAQGVLNILLRAVTSEPVRWGERIEEGGGRTKGGEG